MSNETRVRVEFFSKTSASTPGQRRIVIDTPLGKRRARGLAGHGVGQHGRHRIVAGIGQIEEMPSRFSPRLNHSHVRNLTLSVQGA
jgi:hypothetical protein